MAPAPVVDMQLPYVLLALAVTALALRVLDVWCYGARPPPGTEAARYADAVRPQRRGHSHDHAGHSHRHGGEDSDDGAELDDSDPYAPTGDAELDALLADFRKLDEEVEELERQGGLLPPGHQPGAGAAAAMQAVAAAQAAQANGAKAQQPAAQQGKKGKGKAAAAPPQQAAGTGLAAGVKKPGAAAGAAAAGAAAPAAKPTAAKPSAAGGAAAAAAAAAGVPLAPNLPDPDAAAKFVTSKFAAPFIAYHQRQQAAGKKAQ